MQNAKILVVHPDLALSRRLQELLAQDGIEIVTAGSACAALRAFDAEQPDLVILEVMLPDMDGFQACRRLRRRSRVPIILLSPCSQEDAVITGLACGADDYTVEPCDLLVLRARIRALLRRAAMHHDTLV